MSMFSAAFLIRDSGTTPSLKLTDTSCRLSQQADSLFVQPLVRGICLAVVGDTPRGSRLSVTVGAQSLQEGMQITRRRWARAGVCMQASTAC